MFGRIHIESPQEHAAWVQANSPVTSLAARSERQALGEN
jgi:hypothetical protein